MSKRLEKLHKRKVARAKAKVRTSEPDLRTPEQVKAAREASRAPGTARPGSPSVFAAASNRQHTGGGARTPAKADA
jgi:hypothetical protein